MHDSLQHRHPRLPQRVAGESAPAQVRDRMRAVELQRPLGETPRPPARDRHVERRRVVDVDAADPVHQRAHVGQVDDCDMPDRDPGPLLEGVDQLGRRIGAELAATQRRDRRDRQERDHLGLWVGREQHRPASRRVARIPHQRHLRLVQDVLRRRQRRLQSGGKTRPRLGHVVREPVVFKSKPDADGRPGGEQPDQQSARQKADFSEHGHVSVPLTTPAASGLADPRPANPVLPGPSIFRRQTSRGRRSVEFYTWCVAWEARGSQQRSR